MFFSPKKERFFGGIQLLKRRAPILGGSFALWGGLFSLTDCTLIHLRNETDYINPIVAGALTGGFLAIRGIIETMSSWYKNCIKKCYLWGHHFGHDSISRNRNAKNVNERINEDDVTLTIIIIG
jgi:hypothetical protein